MQLVKYHQVAVKHDALVADKCASVYTLQHLVYLCKMEMKPFIWILDPAPITPDRRMNNLGPHLAVEEALSYAYIHRNTGN